MVNPEILTKELIAAGIEISGCNENGVVWDRENREIQDMPDVRTILDAHNPEAKVAEITLDDKVEALWKAVIENDPSLLSEIAVKG